VLHDRAFGTLEVQLVDGGTTETLPDGLVARAPAPKS
jgi:hypothetical protein